MAKKNEFVLNVKNLSKKFKRDWAVKDVNLEIRKGELFGFIGPNGAGQTTSVRLLCGLLTPDAGSGNCLGFNIINETTLGNSPQRKSIPFF